MVLGLAHAPPAPQIPDAQSVFCQHGTHEPAVVLQVFCCMMQSLLVRQSAQLPVRLQSGREASLAAHSEEAPPSTTWHARQVFVDESQIGSDAIGHCEDCTHEIVVMSGGGT